MRAIVILLSAVIALTTSIHAHAWGVDGHKIIAAIARQSLQPPAAKEVARTLEQEPGTTLAYIST